MPPRRFRFLPLLAAVFLGAFATYGAARPAPLGAQAAPPSATAGADVRDLPLVEVPVAANAQASAQGPAQAPARRAFAILMTGDGDWAAIDRGVAGALAEAGVPVVGLKARAWLERGPHGRRTPDELARDVERIARAYSARWGRDRVLLLGYSRGADWVPFVINRLSPDVRDRVAVAGQYGSERAASFEFHFMDLLADRPRASDVPVAPELARMAALPHLRAFCVYGADQRDSSCPGAPASVRQVARGGAHHFDKDYAALGRLAVDALVAAGEPASRGAAPVSPAEGGVARGPWADAAEADEPPCPLALTLAARLRDAREALTARWLGRIAERVALDPNRVFPTDELLDHVPLLLAGVADYIERPGAAVQADSAVMAKAMELGAMRHAQGFDVYEVLKEYEILGGILFTHMEGIVDTIPEECSRGELFVCAHRVFQAVALIQQATVVQYLQRLTERLQERDERLRAFNRTLAHEFRNRIGAASGAAQLLGMLELPDDDRHAMADVVVRNVDGMRATLENLLELSRMGQADTRQQRHVLLPRAAAEVARSLRDFAAAHRVEVRVGELPEVEVSAAAVELCLANLVSNAVKYADPAASPRWVAVDGELASDGEAGPEVVVRVRDNGLGVPEAQRGGLFRRFFRAHEHSASHVEGTGLGLSIVRETVRALGGRVWAEFPAVGTVFAFALPARRRADRGEDGGEPGGGA